MSFLVPVYANYINYIFFISLYIGRFFIYAYMLLLQSLYIYSVC